MGRRVGVMLGATSSSFLLLLSTTNIHFVTGTTGNGGKGVQRGLTCKANGLARILDQKFNQNLNKQRIKARNGKIRGEPASQLKMASQLEMAFKGKLNTVERQKACLGGAELEAQLGKAIDIMKDVDSLEKMRTRVEAKLAALLSQEGGLQKVGDPGRDYQGGLAALGPIIQAGLPIAMQLLQGAVAGAGEGGGAAGGGGALGGLAGLAGGLGR